MSIRVRFTRNWGLSLTTSTTENFSATALSIEYQHPFANSDFIRGFLGLGIGRYGLEGETTYGDRVTSYSSSGGYDYLASIKMQAYGMGFPLSLGIELSTPPDGQIALILQGRYLMIPELTETVNKLNYTVNLSSLTFGATLMFYL